MKKKLLIVFFAFLMVFSFVGCGNDSEDINDGTDTTVREDIDDATDSVKNGIEDTGDAIKDGIEDTGDAIRDNNDGMDKADNDGMDKDKTNE